MTGATVLTPKKVGDLSGTFLVPSYQRGYRWGEVEVRRLLDDIAAAGIDDYYLQPIVVKATTREDTWELVDGQQRLTTLYLIDRYIRSNFTHDHSNYRMEYETREGSAAYLDTLDETKRLENIDFFHMFRANEVIDEWFSAQKNKLGALMKCFQALSETVHVIWYEADTSENSADLFARLNVGKIPLTDAELVKAQLLSETRRRDPEKAQTLAAEWDAVERDLRAPEAWAFISGRSANQASNIQILLDVLAGVGPAQRASYGTFEALCEDIQTDPQAFWDRVMAMHSRIIGWYEDSTLYHRIGYLTLRGVGLHELLQLSEGVGRSAFDARLVQRIRQDLGLSADALRSLTYRGPKTERALFLMNVEAVRVNANPHDRYPFHQHALSRWSLEHIHAQDAEELTTAEQWNEWVQAHISALQQLDGAAAESISTTTPKAGAMTRADFDLAQERIQAAFSELGQQGVDEVDSIENLALLGAEVNSSLSNSYFEVKRQQVIAMDREGRYIPPCTRNVFLKYYGTDVRQQLHFWGPQDRAAYMDAIVETLHPYLMDGADDDE